MSATKFVARETLSGLVESLAGAGVQVIAPARAADGALEYQAINRLEEADLEAAEVPRRSLRAVFQPPTEPLFTWVRTESGIGLTPAAPDNRPRVVLGAKPCDAAGVETLDAVMGWDYRDDPWFARRDATTIISLACGEPLPSCFCEEVGGGRALTRGSDLMLHPSPDGYTVQVVSEKGEAFVASHGERFTEATEALPVVETAVEPLPLEAMRGWLESHFEDDLWPELSLRCLGCGACTSICPTCHCFDLVDETDGTQSGRRRRNWDTCQAGLFTLHASGHNPRADQTARCRQRVMHKFAIYPAKFGQTLCTGCGRCVSACPAGVNIPEILHAIAHRANADKVGEHT